MEWSVCIRLYVGTKNFMRNALPDRSSSIPQTCESTIKTTSTCCRRYGAYLNVPFRYLHQGHEVFPLIPATLLYPSAGIIPDYESSSNALISLTRDDIVEEAME